MIKTEWGNAKINSDGYLHITSKKEGYHHQKLHRLIWEKHNGPIPKNHVIHHIDGDKLNNDINNLQCMEFGEHSTYHNYINGFGQYGGLKPAIDTKLKMSINQNTSGYFRVVIRRRGNWDYYEYHYYEDGKRKTITRKTIEILKEEVLKRNLEWIELKDVT